MKKKLLIILSILIVVGGVYFTWTKTQKKEEPKEETSEKQEETPKETEKEEEKEEPKEEEVQPEEPEQPEEPIVEPSRHTNYPGTTSKGYTVEVIDGIAYINGILIANKTYSLPSDYYPGGLLNDFLNPYYEMQAAASNDGISLEIISGFRSYDDQDWIYNNYVDRDGREAADRYSARPGHSEHQTGLAADINSLYQSWGETAEGIWLNTHCADYGFIIRYPQGKESITGYMYEPWHIRYVGKDLAQKLYNNGDWITLEEYFGITSQY